MNRKAFTLIELLVVIAIIAILAAILFPVFARVRAKAQQTQCISNLKQLATALRMYASDYGGMLPPQPSGGNWWRTPKVGVQAPLYQYLQTDQVWRCPSQEVLNAAGGVPGPYTVGGVRYDWHGIVAQCYGLNNATPSWMGGRILSQISRTTEIVTFADGIGGGSGSGEQNQATPWCCYTAPNTALWYPPADGAAAWDAINRGLTNDPPYWPSGAARTWPAPYSFVGRHNSKCNAAFIDGHAKAMDLKDMCTTVFTVGAWPARVYRYLQTGGNGE